MVIFANHILQKHKAMKKILGLDLGTGSIGWALVNEGESALEKSSIVKTGVRVNPLTADEQTNFEKGKPITTNANRTLKRGMRRNLQRYRMRRDCLAALLKDNGWIGDGDVLAEQGNKSTFETWRLRAKAAEEAYGHLVGGRYADYLALVAGTDSLPGDYREQLLANAKQFVAWQEKEHGGIDSVAVLRVDTPATAARRDVFLALCFGDSTREEVVVPMVETAAGWRMK